MVGQAGKKSPLADIRNQSLALHYAGVYNKNSEWLHGKDGNPEMPLIDIYVTDNCNANCPMCIAPRGTNHLPIDSVERIQEFSPRVITLTGGGEPSVYKYGFENYVAEIRKRLGNIPLGVMTNGIRQMDADALRELEWIRISINAVTHASYKKTYGIDQLERVIANLPHYINNVNGNVGIGFVYNSQNLEEIFIIARILIGLMKRLNVDDCKKINLQLRPQVTRDYVKYKITKQHRQRLQRQFEKMPNDIREFLLTKSNFSQLLEENKEEPVRPFDNCHISLLQMDVDADGGVYPCPQKAHHQVLSYGNIMDPNFLQKIRGKLTDQFNECNSETCPQCPQAEVNHLFDAYGREIKKEGESEPDKIVFF